MGFDDLVNKAKDALGGQADKIEELSDQGIEKAKEAAANNPLADKVGSDKIDAAGEFLDGKVGE